MHNAGIKVILIMDNDEVYGNGTADANLAAQQAVALRAPANGTVAIYRDVEPSDSPSSTYLNAWYNELLVKGFIPGFYVNPLSSHPFAGDFCGIEFCNHFGLVPLVPATTPNTVTNVSCELQIICSAQDMGT